MGPLIPAIVGGALNMGSSYMQYKQQQKQNELDWSRQQEMYNRQRKDAQEDWMRQNEYNSPEQQMNRLRQAGLNPNLVYGKGADNTAMAVRSSSNTPQSQIAPKMDLSGISGAFGQYFNLKQQIATTDNLYQARQNMIKDGLLTDAKTANTIGDTAKTKFDLQQAQELKDTVIKQAKLNALATEANTANTQANTQKTTTETQISLDRNEREKLTTTTNVAKTLQDIYTSKLQNTMIPKQKEYLQEQINNLTQVRKNAELENQLKQFDLDLRQKGVDPADPAWLKLMEKWFGGDQDWFENWMNNTHLY